MPPCGEELRRAYFAVRTCTAQVCVDGSGRPRTLIFTDSTTAAPSLLAAVSKRVADKCGSDSVPRSARNCVLDPMWPLMWLPSL